MYLCASNLQVQVKRVSWHSNNFFFSKFIEIYKKKKEKILLRMVYFYSDSFLSKAICIVELFDRKYPPDFYFFMSCILTNRIIESKFRKNNSKPCYKTFLHSCPHSHSSKKMLILKNFRYGQEWHKQQKIDFNFTSNWYQHP